MVMHRSRRGRTAVIGVVTAALLTAGCSAGPSGADEQQHHDGPAAGPGGLPSRHVHAVTRDPGDGHVLLATHDGLFRLAPGTPAVRVGPVIDLMGFTAAGPGHFYASGHPGPGTDLPNPVGLIESTDGGQSWTPLSRQGRSDFHTLTASTAGIVGFDGDELVATADGRTWQPLTPPVTPHATATAPDGSALLVTSDQGLARSVDRGRTWTRVTTTVPLQLVAFADATHVAAAAPDGQVVTSDDAGATWKTAGSIGGPPHALGALRTATGTEILAVTAAGLLRSVDGAAFTAYQP